MIPTVHDRFEVVEYLAVLSIGAVRIGLPQNEIHTLESVNDLRAADSGRAVGTIQLDDGRWRIYSLSEDLVPLPALPESQRVCVLLGDDDELFGIACDHFASIPGRQVRKVPAPETLVREGSPVLSFGVHEEEVLCLSTARALARFLRSQGCLEAPAADAIPDFDEPN